MAFANMTIGERIALAASLATTQHVLKSVEAQRDQSSGNQTTVAGAARQGQHRMTSIGGVDARGITEDPIA